MSVLRPTLKSELAAVVVWELVVVELALSFDEPQPAASTARAASSASGRGSAVSSRVLRRF